MPTYDSGRAADLGGINIRSRRGSDLNGIRFGDNRSAAPTSANDMVLYRVSNSLRFWDGSTEYNLLTSVSGSVGDLNGVYENGSAVTVDEGPIILTDPTSDALDTLRITKSGAGSGDSLEFLHTAAATGRAIYIDMNDAIARTGILIDSGGTARTGADIVFTDDSTGAHSVLDINSSGSGASIGFDFTGTFSGSPAGSAISITLGNGNNLDTNGILFTGGTGVRTAPVINIDDAGTGSASMIDIDLTGAYTGDIFNFATSGVATGNVLFVNLDTAVAMTALHIEGSGARTQPMIELAPDATGATDIVDITIGAAGTSSGHIFDINVDGAITGDVLNVDMNLAVGGRFLFLDAGNGTRTANLITVTNDGDGNVDFIEVNSTNTGTAHIFDINMTGAASGNVLDVVVGAALYTGDAINIDLGATATGSQAIVLTSGVMTRTTNLLEIAENGAASGNTIDVGIGAVTYTGNVLDINMGATATGGQAIVLTSGAMTRTVSLVQVIENGTSSGATFDIDRTAATTGIVFDIDDTTGVSTGNVFDYATTQASTGVFFNLNFTNAVAMRMLETTLAGTRTQNAVTITHTAAGAVDICQIDDSGTSSGEVFDINMSGNSTGDVFDIVCSAGKVAGHIFNIELGTNLAGNAININQLTGNIRTAPLIHIANAGTDAATDDHVIFIEQTGLLDSNIIDITYSSAASTGDAINIDMGTNVAGTALTVVTAGDRTGPVFLLTGAGTDGGTDDHIFDINQTGLLDSNVFDVTYSAGISTGNAIDLNMGTNVAGMALSISSAGTGAVDEGNAIDIVHTGILIGGADVVSIVATGAISATSNALYIATIGDAGAYALKINATGSAEGLHVDAGTVLFDETLTVTGAVTMSAAATVGTTLGVTGAFTTNAEMINAGIEDIAAGGTTTALALTETVHTIAADAGGDTFTLANGTAGQIMYIIAHGEAGTATITPATTNGTWTSITFNALNDSVILMYTSLGWTIIGGNSYTIV